MKPLSKLGALAWLKKLSDWRLAASNKEIHRSYRMKDFMAAIHLIRRIAQVAEAMDHHPDLSLVGYRNLKITLSTHSIGGLSKKDFVLAGKIEALPKKLKVS